MTFPAVFLEESSSAREQIPELRRLQTSAMQARLDQEEHSANVVRLRKIAEVGIFVWPLFFGTDWLMVNYIHPGSFTWYLALRGWAWLVLVGVAIRLHRTPAPSSAVLRRFDAMLFASVCGSIAVMSVISGGLTSYYAGGIPLTLMTRCAFVAIPWRASLLPAGLGAISFPLAQLVGALLFDDIAAQFHEPAALSVFAFHCGLIFTAFFYTVVGGNVVWGLRRQIFAARNLGRYRLVDCIGRGGMGEVWTAHHATLRKDVAVKILRTDRANDTVALQRFEREVQATASLTHPNTIRIFDYGVTDDGLWYYAMELLDGEDLASLVEREGPLEEARCVRVMLQVCGALAEAHAQEVVHRDIKPANVFLCQAGGLSDFVKVLDFGIAKVAQSEGEQVLTHGEPLLGTPKYLSPEAALGKPADTRSDVYSLGALIYFLLTGEAPFAGEGNAALLAHALYVPASPSERRGEPLHPAIEQLTLRCLAKDPNQRFPDAGALQEELTRILPELERVNLVSALT